MPGKKQRRGGVNKRAVITVVIAVLVIALITAAPYLNLPFDLPTWGELLAQPEQPQQGDAASQELSVHIIDVGQGDCILIKSGGSAMLIDAGERGNDEKIAAYLRETGVQTLEYVVATHPHSDHIGSMPQVIETFEVKNIIMPKLPSKLTPTTKIYERLLTAVKSSGAKVIAATPGAKYSLGEADITILGPVGEPEDLNNASVVLRLDYGSTSFVFTGDAEEAAEKRIMQSAAQLKADVLKLGHHGSSTSTCDEFLSAVSPSLALIPCGRDNDYGHPHEETVERLEAADIAYERTDIRGTLIVGSDGNSLTVQFPDAQQEGE